MKYFYDANRQESRLYQRWNATTATCFYRHMICKGCPNFEACNCNKDNFNKYHIRQIKYAVLMTMANIGKPKKEYLYENSELDI